MEYLPRPGFVGADTFSVEAFFPAGAETQNIINVTVK
jgi:hypothetical protein